MRNYFNKFFSFFACLFFFVLFTGMAFAADVIEPPSQMDIMAFLAALGGLKGASALVIAAAVVQGIMLALRSSVGNFLGKWRLTAVLLLSVVAGVIALRISGVSLGAALMHSTTLAALQVLANQIYKQFFEKKD